MIVLFDLGAARFDFKSAIDAKNHFSLEPVLNTLAQVKGCEADMAEHRGATRSAVLVNGFDGMTFPSNPIVGCLVYAKDRLGCTEWSI